MKSRILSLCRWVSILAVMLALSGCLNLKPAQDPTRHFVLTSLVPAPDASLHTEDIPVFGLGAVRISGYLQADWLAVRKGMDEIVYLEDFQWAERLDHGVNRVLASNFRNLLGVKNVYLKVWLRDVVDYEIDLEVSHFEPDDTGKVTLSIDWKITLPGGLEVVDSGRALIETQGPKPNLDPAGTAKALSQALAEFSLQFNEQLKVLPVTRPRS